jgi:hypothetical protein
VSSKEENFREIKLEVGSALNLHTKGTNPVPHWAKGGPRACSDPTPFLYVYHNIRFPKKHLNHVFSNTTDV